MALLGFLNFASKVGAAPSNNPFQATIATLEQMIANAVAPLNNLLNNHDQRIAELENTVEDLEARVEILEATPTPTATFTPTPIVTPTPDLRPFEASLSREGNQFIITSNKIIKDCRYRISTSNGSVTTTVISQNTANGTNICSFSSTSTGSSYSITVKDELGDTKTFNGTI